MPSAYCRRVAVATSSANIVVVEHIRIGAFRIVHKIVLAHPTLVAAFERMIWWHEMVRREIVLDTTKPETEWVRGRALQKTSPTYRHGVTQMRVAFVLDAWSQERRNGRVATEWRFRVTPPGEATRPLVPDVAFVAFDVLPDAAGSDAVDVPKLAPTLAVEILSSDDRADDVRDNVSTYLGAGTIAVFVIDPATQTAVAYDRLGMRSFASPGVLAHGAFEDLAIELERIFKS